MSRRIAAAALLLAAAWAAWWWLGRKQDRETRAERAEARLLQFDDRELKSLTLSTGGVDWRFDRLPDGWRLTAPFRDAVRNEMLEAFIGAFRRSPVDRTIDDPEALSSYGLEPPRARVHLEGARSLVVDLGDTDPTRSGVFVRVEGRKGVLVAKLPDALPLAQTQPSILRDDTVTGVLRAEIDGWEVRRAGSAIAVARERGGWWVTQPIRLPASDAKVDKLLDALDAARVAGFADGADPADPRYGLSDGAVELVIRGGGRSRTVTLGAENPDRTRFARRDDRQSIFVLPDGAIPEIPADPRAIAETKLTKTNRYAVSRFAYTAPAGRLAAAKVDDKTWRTEAGKALQAGEAYGLLVRVLEAPVDGWESGSAQGAAIASLEFETADGGKDRVEFFPGGRAAVASLPGIVCRVASPPPPIP